MTDEGSATLLDGSVLIPLLNDDHIHHAAASAWKLGHAGAVAVCPITQGSLFRFLVRLGYSSLDVLALWDEFVAEVSPQLWADDIFYDADVMRGVIGHRQVTDVYLAALARAHSGRLATFDAGLAAMCPDVVDLVPT